VTIVGVPELIVGFYSLNTIMKVPSILNYKYCNIVNYTSQPENIGVPGTSFQINSQAIQLQAIPRAVLLSVTKSTKTWQDPDAYSAFRVVQAGGAVNNQNVISITFNNKVVILSSASVHDLYLLSRNNGLEMTYGQCCGRQLFFYNLFASVATLPYNPYYTNANSGAIFMN